jgi:hypothetical protein
MGMKYKHHLLPKKYYKSGWVMVYLVYAVMIVFAIIHYFAGVWLPD